MGLFNWIKKRKLKQLEEKAKLGFEEVADVVEGMRGINEVAAEETEEGHKIIFGKGDNKVILPNFVKEHIAEHREIGKGSVFSPLLKQSDVDKAVASISEKDFEKEGGPGMVSLAIPNAGYNLVDTEENIKKEFPDAKKVMVTKMERGKEVQVPGYIVPAEKEEFATDTLNVVVRPTNPEFLPEDLKANESVMSDVEKGKSFSVLSSFPGNPDVPPASKWNESGHAVIIPQGVDVNGMTRREFLKLVGKGALGGAVLGSGVGKIADMAIDKFRGEVQEVGNKLDKLDKAVEKTPIIKEEEKLEQGIVDKWRDHVFRRSKEDQAKARQAFGIGKRESPKPAPPPKPAPVPKPASEPENITRRDFIKQLFGFAVEHPVATGAAAGAAVGAVKSVPRATEKAKEKKKDAEKDAKIAKLEREVERLKKDKK